MASKSIKKLIFSLALFVLAIVFSLCFGLEKPRAFAEENAEIIQQGKTSTIFSSDNSVKLTALDKSGNPLEIFEFFPEDNTKNVTVKICKSQNESGLKTANKAVKKSNKKLEIAFYFKIKIVSGESEWTCSDDEALDKIGAYRIEIDLEKFCESYYETDVEVKSFSTKLARFFSNSKVSRFDDVSGAYQLTRTNSLEENSSGNDFNLTSGSVSSATDCEYNLEDGKLMFTTNELLSTLALLALSQDMITYIIIAAIAVVALTVIIILTVLIYKHIKYTFKFETNGGSPLKPVKAKKNQPFPMPDPPVKKGYAFAGWFADPECTIRFLDTYVLKRKSKKIYVKWIESDIPEKYVHYFEDLRNEMLSYAKVGAESNMGLTEKETLARLFADEQGVHFYVGLVTKGLIARGYDVEDCSEEYSDTPSLYEVNDKQSFKEAQKLIEFVMAKKNMQNVGLGHEPEPMTIEERQNGFAYEIENDRVAISLSDCYELLRVYAKSFALYNPAAGVEEGDVIVRLYMTKENIELYLAQEASGSLETSDRFKDTPSLYRVVNKPEEMEKAYRYIDRVMAKNGLEKKNEVSNLYEFKKVEPGCGSAYSVKLGEGI